MEDGGDADFGRREVAGRSPRGRTAPRRSPVHDRKDHDGRKSRLASAMPAWSRRPAATAHRRGVMMAYDRYPAPQERSNRPQERSNRPQYVHDEPHYYGEQPA